MQANEINHEVSGMVLMTTEGLYIQANDNTTHTGRHVVVGYVTDINQATVFSLNEERTLYRYNSHLHGKMIRIEASLTVSRSVTLVPPKKIPFVDDELSRYPDIPTAPIQS